MKGHSNGEGPEFDPWLPTDPFTPQIEWFPWTIKISPFSSVCQNHPQQTDGRAGRWTDKWMDGQTG